MLQVIEGEAMALLGAIQWVLSSGFQNVIFETDSKILSDAIFRKKEDISELSL
jgi:ribonuclease HI